MPTCKNTGIWTVVTGVIILWSAAALSQTSPYPDYRIGPSDVLSVHVMNQPDLTRNLSVRPDGVITYPLVGDMYVAGLTTSELGERLISDLEKYVTILSSEVTVSIEAVNSYTVSILGEVNLPGRYSFQSQVTVLDVLAQAGGFSAFANRSDIVILRNDKDQVTRIPFNYRDILRNKTRFEPTKVYPGDIIMVP